MKCGTFQTKKYGKQNNKQRYCCYYCNLTFICKNKRKSIARQIIWFKKWIIGKRTLQEIADKKGLTIRTIQTLFKNYLDNPPIPKIKFNHNCHLIIDGTYTSDFCILNYLDSDLKYLQFYNIVKRENHDNYVIDLILLKQSELNIVSITSDGQKGLIKAVKQVFPNVIHQRCIIHIQRMSLIYLTRNPKTEAGVTLRYWIRKLHKINSHEEKDFWIMQFDGWCNKYDLFLKEKSQSLSGRKWYTHKLLRRTRSLIKNALPNMFHYLDNPKIPKSSNGLECRFSYLKNNLSVHRGLSRKNRRNFILWYNYFKYNS